MYSDVPNTMESVQSKFNIFDSTFLHFLSSLTDHVNTRSHFSTRFAHPIVITLTCGCSRILNTRTRWATRLCKACWGQQAVGVYAIRTCVRDAPAAAGSISSALRVIALVVKAVDAVPSLVVS